MTTKLTRHGIEPPQSVQLSGEVYFLTLSIDLFHRLLYD